MDGCDDTGSACARCVTLAAAVAERDGTIRELSATLERVTARLKWEGLDDNALTVAQGYEAFRRARQNDKAWTHYRNRLAPLVARLGSRPCLQLGPEEWADHIAHRRQEPCGRWSDREGAGPACDNTLDQELRTARMMMKFLVDTGKLPRNPLTAAKKLGGPTGRETYLTWDDVQRLIEYASVLAVDKKGRATERRVLLFRAFVAVKFGGFLRLEETLPLRRDRIGPDGAFEVSARGSKGKKRQAKALPPFAMASIAAVPILDGDQRIFMHRYRGKLWRITGQAMRNWWHVVCRASGVDARAIDGEVVVPHILRHSAASHAEAQGAHPMDIRDAMGHASLATTEIYMHSNRANRAKALADLMGARLPPQRAAAREKSAEPAHSMVDGQGHP